MPALEDTPDPFDEDFLRHAHTATVTTDEQGRLALTSIRCPNSPANQPFSFVNALEVVPLGTYNATRYAHRPDPRNGSRTQPAEGILSWRPGANNEARDVYMGLSAGSLTRVSQNQAGTTYDPYDPGGATEFLKLDKDYFWRVDEIDTTPNPDVYYTGEVWHFRTLPYAVVDDFESYGTNNPALRAVWQEALATTVVYTNSAVVHTGDVSMELDYRNSVNPFYAQVTATMANLGMDPNWTEMEAKSLTVWFYGLPTNNIAGATMYVKLTDSGAPAQTATVLYSGSASDLQEDSWHEWNIPLSQFPNVNKKKVASITLGIGNAIDPGDDPNGLGIVYFDDIRIYATRCALQERDPCFARTDFAPGGTGDCSVDTNDLGVFADGWLAQSQVVETNNPDDGDVNNLVLYYPLNEGDGNMVYPAKGSGGDAATLSVWSGTLWNRALEPPEQRGVTMVTNEHAPLIGGAGCLFVDGDYGSRIDCGTFGQAGLGIGNDEGDSHEITVSLWTKWLGPRVWDSYLRGKSSGLLGKRGGWDDASMTWMLEVDTGVNGALGWRHFAQGDAPPMGDVYTAYNTMYTYLNRWTHIAVVFDGTDANLYIGGARIYGGRWRFSNGYDPNIFLSIGCTMDINAWPNCPESYYGYIDEVRIYNRALEPNEVAYLADTTPEDGYLMIPVPSLAEAYKYEDEDERVINFKDLALIAENWLTKDMYPSN
jgi:hypothetical protein